MHSATIILVGCLSAMTAALLVFWSAGLYQLIRTTRAVPTARAGLLAAERRTSTPAVCIVIPVHNEEKVIARHVQSLRAQDYPALRVVLALDRCTDGTAAAARHAIGDDGRFSIVEISACPPDWAGKVHAVWSGVNGSPSAREADLLLFADADTTFSPRCVSATVALMQERSLDLLSLISTLTGGTWYERVVQPAAGFELMRQYPLVRANRAEHKRPFANGQFMLFRADAYRAVGGHESVKAELLEDLALARLMSRQGRRTGVFLADGVLTCRMYTHWPAFRKGWKRIYTEAANRRARRLRRAAWEVRFTGSILPIAAILLLVVALFAVPEAPYAWRIGLAALACAGLAVFLLTVAWVYRLSHAALWAVPGYIAGSWMVGYILSEAAGDLRSGTPTTWAGRSYVRENRSA